jgi:signal transduction histidine kinase/CheY-like chemotaxis protein
MTEITIRQPGGGVIEAEIRIVETTWDNRPALLASVRDVSGRRLMEDRLRHAAKMEAVGRLTAGIAHDFNNLLTVVLGNLHTVKQRLGPADVVVVTAIENATRGAQQAAQLTGKLLAFARRKPLEFRLVDVKQLLSGMSDLLRRTLGESIAIKTVLPASLWLVEIDPTELESAILNLAVNARDAMPEGGELVIEAANVEQVAAEAIGGDEAGVGPHVRISVSDTGSGMAPEVLSRIFEPFFTTKPDGRGTGLGLSQVYGFVKQSGGHIAISSKIGAGTRLDIFLPQAAATADVLPQAEPSYGASSDLSARPGEVVLVVEDEADVRSYTTASLRELGYSVREAHNAAAGFELLRSEPRIDLLFTDLGLPGENGKALTERARALRPELKVLLTSGYAGELLIQDGRLDADVELLSKPFSAAALGMRIRELLDKPGAAPRSGGTILVVEDESLVHLLITEMLSEHGFATESASTFREALQIAKARAHDLTAAIIDRGLPDRPGDELVGELRALRPDLPIVLATGYADEVMRASIAAARHLQLLMKPFGPGELTDAFRRIGIRSERQ